MNLNVQSIVLILAIVLSGCNAAEPGTPASEPTPKALPEKPQTLTNQSVVSYVSECERASLWNDMLDGGISDIEYDRLYAQIVSRNGTIYTSTVYVRGELIWETPEPEGLGFEYTARYVVNDSPTTRQVISGSRPYNNERPCE